LCGTAILKLLAFMQVTAAPVSNNQEKVFLLSSIAWFFHAKRYNYFHQFIASHDENGT
jgi:hypothetical protein